MSVMISVCGTTYFKKHLSAFYTVKGLDTPEQLFHSITTATTQDEQHKTWYKEIRTIISDRITNEEERPPSYIALWCHWLRSCWVCQMWKNSPTDQLYRDLSPPEQSGWERNENGDYSVDWDSPEACKQVQETIEFLIKGCSCRKGCHTRQCGCRKKGRHCGPGCECHGCVNLPLDIAETSDPDTDQQSGSDDDPAEEEIQPISGKLSSRSTRCSVLLVHAQTRGYHR